MYWISENVFSKFQHILLFWEWSKYYFWIRYCKINNNTNFHKNSVNKTQNMNENALPRFPRWLPGGRKRRIVVQTFNHNIAETIWDRTFIVQTTPHKGRGGVNFDYLPLEGGTEKFKKGGRSMVKGQVFLKGEGLAFSLCNFFKVYQFYF